MEASIGVNLRVTAHSNQGGRKYMEDMFCVAYQPTADDRDLLYAYFGIFDGHGGREAALYAKHHLMDHIVKEKNFWSDDDELVLKAIRDGFINTHYAMWKELDKWPRTPSGLPSTSGTTASIAFVRRGKLYIGHVGDSGIVMGYEDPETGFWRAKPLTKDHKPESPAEANRISQAGGKVIIKSGVPRVVWNRPRIGHKGPVRRSTLIDEIPFLAVARSLGDLWSYNSEQDEFVVSPYPDVSVIDIDVHNHRCLILGTDGLWNMLNPQDAVNSVYFAEKNNERQPQPSQASNDPMLSKSWINPSKRLVDRALDRWLQYGLRADNTSVVTVVVDPPGPPKDPAASPVGISRYVPNKSATCISTSQQKSKEKDNTALVPCSSSTTAHKLPTVSQPRVIPKVASSLDTVTNAVSSGSRTTRATKGTRSSGRSKRGSPSSSTSRLEAAINESDANYQSSHAVSASSPALTRSWRENHRSSPVAQNETSQSSSHDDVQIHEISSSSESTKSPVDSKVVRRGKKRKGVRSVSKAKKIRVCESIERRPTTRNSSQSAPSPLSTIKRTSKAKVDRRICITQSVTPTPPKGPIKKTVFLKPKASRIPTSKTLQSKSKLVKKQSSQPQQRVLKGRVEKRKLSNISIVHHTKLEESSRSLRSTSRSMARCLRKM